MSELVGRHISDFAADYYPIGQETDNDKGQDGYPASEYEVRFLNGHKLEVEVRTIEVVHEGKPALMSMFQDITARKRVEREIAEAEFRYRSLVESALVGVYLYKDKRLTYINPYIVNLLGYSLEEISVIDFSSLVYPEDMDFAPRISMEGTTRNSTYQFRIIKKDGNVINVETQVSFLRYEGSTAIIGTLLDMTHLKEAEALAKHMAYHDVLTGLPNRYLFNEYTHSAIQNCKKSNSTLGIMFLDLDRFKVINDTMGHSFGDLILQEYLKLTRHLYTTPSQIRTPLS